MKYLIHIFIVACMLGIYIPVNAQQDNKKFISNESIEITTYPNPVINVLNIKLSPALRQQVYKIQIVNIVGKKIREQQVLDRNTTDVAFSDLDDVPQGVYLVIARDEFGKVLQSNKFMLSK